MATLMSQACERCWRRKQKCSRETPTCLQCRTASKDCVQRCFGSTSNDPDASNETGIEALKSRVRALREQVQNSRQQDNQILSHTPSSRAEREGPRTHESHETMQDDVAYLSLSAMAERTDRRPFLTGSLSLLTLLYAATGVCGANPTLSVGSNNSLNGPLAEFRQSSTLNIELGSSEMRSAFQLYSERMYTSFPFVTTTELTQDHEDVIRDQETNGEKLALVCLGTATGILLGSHYTFKEIYATELALRAVQTMAIVFDSAGQMSIVRCLIALTIHSLFTSFGGSTWHLLGLSMTRCISAGMHTTRASDPHPDSKAKAQRSRVLWTFYILDTYVSTVLDRPFCLNDSDIQIMRPPRTPPNITKTDNEDAVFRHLIQFSQIMRSVRRTEDTEAGILCLCINFRHWKETIPPGKGCSDQHFASLLTRGYVELLKQSRFFHDVDREIVLEEAVDEFSRYLARLEEQINSHAGAVPALEALHVFAIGVILATENVPLGSTEIHQSPNLQQTPRATSNLLQILNILTLLSSRYSAIRSLREILSELQRSIHQPQSQDRLHMLVACSEVTISDPLQSLLFRGNPSISQI